MHANIIYEYYWHKDKPIFYTTLIFEIMKIYFSFGFYPTCTFVDWLPNFGKLDSFHALLSTKGKLILSMS